jgi:endonuclease YncB( thermonuclease family)
LITIMRLALRLLALPGRLLIHWINERKAANGVPPLGGFLRGSVHAFIWFVIFVLFGVSNSTPSSTGRVAASSPAPTTTTAPSTAPSTAEWESVFSSEGPMPDAASSVQVSRVIDGDTFELVNGKRVRVLGIDSCEATGAHKSPGGAEATAKARELLVGTVTLSSQPGAPDVDRYGRLLRYVQVDGEDFGVAMVGYDHTGVYQGDNDASDAYVEQLYAHDRDHTALPPPSGRECGSYPPPVADDDDDAYVPVPDRDDDDGESRFCSRRWWC